DAYNVVIVSLTLHDALPICQYREAVPVGQLHRAHCLAVALGIGHAEIALRALLDVAALLVADENDRSPPEAPEAGHDRGVVAVLAIAVQFEPVLEETLDIVQRVRPVRVAGQLDGTPDLL